MRVAYAVLVAVAVAVALPLHAAQAQDRSSAFQAVEPTGKSALPALVVPQDFDINRFLQDNARQRLPTCQ
jgi:hypothetical protein